MEIFTRSNNDMLYKMASSFWPKDITAHQIKGMQHWTDAVGFLYHVINNAKDIAVIVDEDCFIYDWKTCNEVIQCCIDYKYTNIGMPDGGVCEHRQHSWITQNPFFLVLNCAVIRDLIKSSGFTYQQINMMGYHPMMEEKQPFFLHDGIGFNHDNVEPFAGLFYFLMYYGNPYYLDAVQHFDGISTGLIHVEKQFCWHSWYSREYLESVSHNHRINDLFVKSQYLHDIHHSI